MAVEEAPGGAGSPEPAQTAGAGRVGADRRFPPRVVRGSGAALHVDRVHRRRHQSAETTEAYMRTLRGYLDQHGRPVAIYSDKHSIFRVNQQDREGDLTQFTRVLKTLDIQPIHANTPQAKGRVERANQTLQDRLVKELRLRGIDDIQSANAFLPEFITDYNQRFSVAPKPPRTPTATCSMTRPPSTSSSPFIPPESSAAISPAVTAAASTRSKARAAATASVAPPSPSVKASTAPSPSCAKARPSTTECSLKASRPSPQTTKKASAVPSTRPAPSSANALATNPPQTTPGTAGLASTQPLPPLPHSHPPPPALSDLPLGSSASKAWPEVPFRP